MMERWGLQGMRSFEQEQLAEESLEAQGPFTQPTPSVATGTQTRAEATL